MADAEMLEARQRMIAKRFGGQSQSRTGGKGSVRRKKKAVHKTATSDDKKLGSTLKKLGVTNIPAIEEVNLFTNDGKVVHFSNPKVQASIAANTYVVSGPNETKQLTEMLPGIINQLGQDNLEHIKAIADNLQGAPGAAAAGKQEAEAEEDGDDDGIPDLVDNFEEAA
eukprot:CAMPEP_0205930070 /NCGR_PEP_ID=MMETSP1325-20131115/25666_1 /ASSEMBLY_ACC=CAM_ASM_000708 /TAXON_ID=236786 /ORGANISM="Florenciella sp., Strain RCC1007" /LENGTH=167 /DNA_ID=CAMNT_0053299379 /DNA_START=38 /DNA_END=541 /DNA_ORIENTATION=-